MQSSIEERARSENASHAAALAVSAAGDTIEAKSEANMMAPSVGTQWLAPEVNPAEPDMRKDDLSPEQVSFVSRKCPNFPEISEKFRQRHPQHSLPTQPSSALTNTSSFTIASALP